jgi:hypothetical protein
MKIGVAIASRGRPDDIANILKLLACQTLPPYRILLSVTGPADLPAGLPEDAAEVVTGSPGLCAQRNRALDVLCRDCDIILFYDDDFIPSRYALQGVAALFASNFDIAGATGLVLDDGICKGGITLDAALKIVRQFDEHEPGPRRIEESSYTYGCNMAFRVNTMRDLRFDECLALYGWQEDVDFSARVQARGAVVRTNAFAGVHRGVTRGRSPGRALGYSQIINPTYLVAKGTMARAHAARLMIRNLIANHLRALHPEPHIDRRGRASGNWAGLLDLLRGKKRPENILRF